MIADTGLEVVPSHRARVPRQPFLGRPKVDARRAAEAVFGAGARTRGDHAGTITSRAGKRVRVEVRRARVAGQMELGV